LLKSLLEIGKVRIAFLNLRDFIHFIKYECDQSNMTSASFFNYGFRFELGFWGFGVWGFWGFGVTYLRETLSTFVGAAEPHDDLTIVTIQV